MAKCLLLLSKQMKHLIYFFVSALPSLMPLDQMHRRIFEAHSELINNICSKQS